MERDWSACVRLASLRQRDSFQRRACEDACAPVTRSSSLATCSETDLPASFALPKKYSDSRGSHMIKRFLLSALNLVALTTVLAAQEPKKENVVPEAEVNAAKAVQAAADPAAK